MKITSLWKPPGKNCGMCGSGSCESFIESVLKQQRNFRDCPFYQNGNQGSEVNQSTDYFQKDEAIYQNKDILGNTYDFVLGAIPNEVSALKIVLPFRSDSAERLNIKAGDYVVGRPMGAGCPIPHVLKVQKAELETGLLYTWVVGPKFSREQETKDVVAYHMIGFEGVAKHVNKEPIIGSRVSFLPGFCMMNLNHTGLVNMVLEKNYGLYVRIEDIRIMNSTYKN